MKRIIDISHWNSPVDFAKLKAAGVDGVYIKCSDGVSWSDPQCQNYAIAAKAQGLAVGYYHFLEPDSDWVAQANFFKVKLYSLPKSDLMPVIDIEKDTTADVNACIQTFANAFGSPLMLYSYTPYIVIHKIQWNGPFWLAGYTPTMMPPSGWNVDLWQFTNASVIDGMPHACDESKPLTQAFVL